MPRGRKPRTWVKMDCEGILRGSINYLLPLDGQAVWMKMIAFSEVCGGRPGFIEDNNQNGLPHEFIAQELHCPVEIFKTVLEKMGGDGAIKENGTGSIELVNFSHYQFSEYDRQKPHRDAKKYIEQSEHIETLEVLKIESKARIIWNEALNLLQQQVNKPNYRTWLEKTIGVKYQDKKFFVGVKSMTIAEYLDRNQRGLIEKVLCEVTGDELELYFQVGKF